MRVTAISDLHGILPDIDPTDLLLISGDICPLENHEESYQEWWLDTRFRWWLESIRAKKIIGICGNHDFIFQNSPNSVPNLPWTYLEDSGTEYEGLKIWGTPWQPYFFNWAFNLYEPDLEKKWALIPNDTDILVLHGPPRGYGDRAPRKNDKGAIIGHEDTGSPSLLEKIKEVKPKLVTFGHIHEGHGQWKLEDTILANVSIIDGQYRHIHSPMVFEIGDSHDER